MKKLLVILLISTVFFSIYRMIQSERLTADNQQNRIEEKIIKSIEKKFNLTSRYSGWTNKHGLKTFNFDFERKGHPLSMDDYRIIIVGCIEEALSIINADRELLPYLCDYPCSENNIHFGLFLRDSKGLRLFSPNFTWLAHYGYKIHYYYDDYGVPLELRNNLEEPYQEALKIYKQHQAGLNASES